MATDLKSENDKTYDPENGDQRPGQNRNRTPIYGSRKYQSGDPRAKGYKDDIASKEKNSGTKDGQNSSANDKEKSLLDKSDGDSLGRGYSSEAKKVKAKGKFSTKRKIAVFAGVASLLTAGIMAIMSPGLLLENMRSILNEKISALQVDGSHRYRRKKIHKVKDLFSKDGRLGGRMIAEMEADGYIFHFDPTDGNTIRGITPPGSSTSIVNNDLGLVGQHIDDYIEIRHPIKSSSYRWKTNRMKAFYNRYGVSPRKAPITKGTTDIEGDPDATVRKNLVEDTYNGDDGNARLGTVADENVGEGETLTTNEADDAFANGNGEFDDIKTRARTTGASISEADPDIRNIINGVETGADDALFESVNNVVARGSLGGRVFRSIRSIIDPTDLPARICTIKNRVRGAVTASRVTRALALLKLTSSFLKAPDALRLGSTDSELTGSLLKSVTTPDSNGLPIGASTGFIYALSGSFSKSQNNFMKPGYGVDGKLTGVIGSIQKNTDNFPGTGRMACNVWTNPVTGVVAAVGQIVISVFTLNIGGAGIQASIQGFKATVTESFKKLTKKAVLSFLRRQLLIELTFEGITTLVQLYAEKILTFPVTGQSTGAKLGGELVAGAGVLNKQRALQSGLVPATAAQYAKAQNEYLARKKEEMKNQSVFARIFDYSNVDSLAFNTVSRVAYSAPTLTGISNNISTSLMSLPGSILGNIGRIFSPSAFAADEDMINFDTYVTEGVNGEKELATDPAGNLLPVMPQYILDADEEENEGILIAGGYINPSTKQPIGVFARHVENCVNSVDTISMIEGGNPSNPDEDCLAELPITKRFKIHLAYLDMVDGLEGEFIPDEISITTSPVTTAPSVDTNIDTAQDTSNLPCAPGFTSERVVAVGAGDISIKLCSYGAVRDVNASWSNNVSQMLEAAESEEGLIFEGGGFRTAARQIELRKANCGTTPYDIYEKPSSECSPPTARPGTSNHELGLAIDFSDMCYPNSTCTGNDRYDWLIANSQRWGIKKLSTEAWHFSWNGH